MPTGNTIAKGAHTTLNCNNRGRQLEAERTETTDSAQERRLEHYPEGRATDLGTTAGSSTYFLGQFRTSRSCGTPSAKPAKASSGSLGRGSAVAAQKAASSSAWQSGPTNTHYSWPSVLSSIMHWACDQRERLQECSRDEGTPRIKPSEKHLKQLGRLNSDRASQGQDD